VLYIIPRLLNGAGFVVLAWAVVDIAAADDVLVLAAVYVLAGTLGTLAFLVPGGLGVREAIITALLAPRFGTAEALTVAGSARLYATVTDLLLFIAYGLVGRGFHTQILRQQSNVVDPDDDQTTPRPERDPLR